MQILPQRFGIVHRNQFELLSKTATY